MARDHSIYSNRCYIEGKMVPATVTFGDGIIKAIDFNRKAGAADVGNDVLMPGVIDAHVHVNEPGRTDWEGFETATRAAAAGGITTLVDMPLNASPVTTSVASLSLKLAAASSKLHINCGFYGGLVPGNTGEIENLLKANVLGIKCFLTHSGIDEFPDVGENELRQVLPLLAKYGIPILAHCELVTPGFTPTDFPGNNYMAYMNSRPRQWENDAVELMINLCREFNCKTHIVHVSSSDVLPMIAAAKAEGLPLTAETCAHYIYFNAEEIPGGDTLFKCAPPIRENENNQLLRQALVSGVLDFIATDHSPAPPDLKQVDSGDLNKAWGGISGLQFLLPVAWTSMKDQVSLEHFIPMLTSHPARFLQLHHRKGRISPGFDADLVIWNPEGQQTVQSGMIQHRHKISPYIGETLHGVVQKTVVNGTMVYDGESGVGNGHFGKVILHTKNF